MTKPLIDQLVDRFLACPLPQSVKADSCACNPNYPHQRTGTNLLTATEAKEVLAKVLEGCSIVLNLMSILHTHHKEPQMAFDLDHIFKYHAPTPETLIAYSAIREAAKVFATVLIENTPEGADQAAALRLVREASMTANAAVALGGRLNQV